MLTAISPVDGRYASKTKALSTYYSEYALIKYRVLIEIKYLLFLNKLQIIDLTKSEIKECNKLLKQFNESDAQEVKNIEKITNHDVKAVEYFLKNKLTDKVNKRWLEFIHFGLTSQDINNTALPLMINDSLHHVILPQLKQLVDILHDMAHSWQHVPMLAHTHGQPASPTTLGKEMYVFVQRLKKQITQLDGYRPEGKFGGATGNFNAHKVAYPDIHWPEAADAFLKSIGLTRQDYTTQIEHYDQMASIFHTLARVNTIFIDLCRDMWTYISMNYFRQKINTNEVGSSAMPHKVNPIDFENAEGNLALANSLFNFLAGKLPISRLQRDLTDSTVTRNIGVPMAHTLISLDNIQKGLSKLLLNESKLIADLNAEWAVVAEAIQTILRREGIEKPYELLKEFSRGKSKLTQKHFAELINSLSVPESVKKELRAITPLNYTGYPMIAPKGHNKPTKGVAFRDKDTTQHQP